MGPLRRRFAAGFGVQGDIAGEILELRGGGLAHAEVTVDAVHRFGDGEPRGQFAEGGHGRPFTTSSGKPRAGGARPSSKPFKPGAASRSKPRPGGFSKSGPKGSSFKDKPGAAKRPGPRPGGKKRS